MRRLVAATLSILLLLTLCAALSGIARGSGWKLTVETDRSFYQPGDMAHIYGRITYNDWWSWGNGTCSVGIGITGPRTSIADTAPIDGDGRFSYNLVYVQDVGLYAVRVNYWGAGTLVTNSTSFLVVLADDLVAVDVEPVQVVPDAQVLLMNKDTAVRVDIISTFSSDVIVPYIDVYYDFGKQYREEGENRNGLEIAPGLNRIYIPGGPIFGIQDGNWKERKAAWSPYHAGGFDWNFFLKWTATGTDNNIGVKVPPLEGEADPDNNERITSRKIADSDLLSILFVPINFTGDPVNLQFDGKLDRQWIGSQVSTWIDYLGATYPVSQVRSYTMWPPQPEDLPLDKPWWYSGSQDDWEFEKLNDIADEWMKLALEWGYDRVVLLFKDVERFTPANDAHGMALDAGQNGRVPVVLDVPYFQEGLAHEIGHTCFLWHPHDKGPNVFATEMCWVDKRQYEENTNTFMSYRYGGSEDKNGNRFPTMWIDEKRYETVARTLTPAGTVLNYSGDPLLQDPIAPACTSNAEDFWSWNLLDECKVGNDPTVLLLNGVLSANGTVQADDPWYVLNGVPDLEEGGSGNYSVIMRDESDQVLGEFHFNCSFAHDEEVNRTYLPIYTHSVPFVFRVPFNETTKSIQLADAAGSVLYTRFLTANPPQLQILNPSEAEILGNPTYTISWSTSDVDGDQLTCDLAYSPDGGVDWCPIATNLHQTYWTWDTAGLKSGDNYLIKVIATDGVNTAQNVTGTFTVDNTPRVNVTSPVGGEVYGGGNHTISWNCSHSTENVLFSVTYSEDGGDGWVPVAIGLNQTSYVWDTTLLESTNNYLIKVVGTDGVNSGEAVSGIFTVDVLPPTIDILSPLNKTYSSGTISLTFEANDPVSGIDSTWYSLDDQPNATTSSGVTIGVNDGAHQIIVYANDTADNTVSSDMICFAVDTVPPSISILSPENKTYYSAADVPLTFEVSETVSWAGYSLDGQDNVTVAGNTTIGGLPDGPHEVTVYANDTVGNMGSSEVVCFAVDTSVHDVAVVNVTTSKTVVGKGYNCTVYATLNNEGDSTEMLNFALYVNTTLIAVQNASLASHASTTVRFAWNTGGLPYGKYTMLISVRPVPGETNITNNNRTVAGVVVTIPGDVDGNFKVDVGDVELVLQAFGSSIGKPGYAPNLDIDGDGRVEMDDVNVTLAHFGEHYP